LSNGQDPDLYITKLEERRDEMDTMGSEMSDQQFIVHILNNLTNEYENVVMLLEKHLEKKGLDN
jgi:hypothetical protein